MDAVDGFVIVTNVDYKLIYVSPSCEKYLGHQNVSQFNCFVIRILEYNED